MQSSTKGLELVKAQQALFFNNWPSPNVRNSWQDSQIQQNPRHLESACKRIACRGWTLFIPAPALLAWQIGEDGMRGPVAYLVRRARLHTPCSRLARYPYRKV